MALGAHVPNIESGYSTAVTVSCDCTVVWSINNNIMLTRPDAIYYDSQAKHPDDIMGNLVSSTAGFS